MTSQPITKKRAQELINKYGSPLYVYDESKIRQNAQSLTKAFSWSPHYKNFFAVKATPAGPILDILAQEGMGFDCATEGELDMIEQRSLAGNGLFFSYAGGCIDTMVRAYNMGAIINFGKEVYIDQVLAKIKDPSLRMMSMRYNPGNLQSGDAKIGEPLNSQFGDTLDHLIIGYKKLKNAGVKDFALHSMVGSDMLDPEYFAKTAELLRGAKDQIENAAKIKISTINIGGGLGVNYGHKKGSQLDLETISDSIKQKLGGLGVSVVSENGRFVTADAGYLLTTIMQAPTTTYRNFLSTDHSVGNSARLASVTGAKHKVEVLGREYSPANSIVVDLTGNQCSGSDRWLKDVSLPADVSAGDILCVYDAGAHMASNRSTYNSNPQANGVLIRPDGSDALVHRGLTTEQILNLQGADLNL